MTDAGARTDAPESAPESDDPAAVASLLGSLAVTVVAGSALVLCARTSALALLVAVAVVQALFAVAWVFGTGMPGRRGALVLATGAAAGADVTASLWPHGRLGTLLVVFGLAVPAAFVHQLSRGTSRRQIVSSLSAVSVLVVVEVSLVALLQLRHDFGDAGLAGRVTAAAVAVIAATLIVGYFTDLVVPAPYFDPAVPRGLIAVLVSTAVGAAVGYLLLRDEDSYADGRAVFVGAALGVLTALVAVAAAFVLHTTPDAGTRLAAVERAVLAALVPLCVLAPAAFVLTLGIRT